MHTELDADNSYEGNDLEKRIEAVPQKSRDTPYHFNFAK